MRADFTPPPPDRSKDPGYFDVTELTMPDPEQVKQVRREINQLHTKDELPCS